MYSVYFIKSIRNKKIYSGVTEKVPEVRLSEHNSGSNEWSRHNGQFELVYYENYFCKKDAERREKKRLSQF